MQGCRQDDLYLHTLSDACLEAVRRLLGPRRALLWIRCGAAHSPGTTITCAPGNLALAGRSTSSARWRTTA